MDALWRIFSIVVMLGVFTIPAIKLIVLYVRVAFQTAERATDRLRSRLNSTTGEVEVFIKGAYPLSAGMIKEVARSCGYSFVGVRTSSGVLRMRFIPVDVIPMGEAK